MMRFRLLRIAVPDLDCPTARRKAAITAFVSDARNCNYNRQMHDIATTTIALVAAWLHKISS